MCMIGQRLRALSLGAFESTRFRTLSSAIDLMASRLATDSS